MATKKRVALDNKNGNGGLSTDQVAKAFGVTKLCISHWRAGDTQKFTKMPHRKTKVGKAVRVSFDPKQTKDWAKKNGLSCKL